LDGDGLFLVEVRILAGDEVEVFVDCDAVGDGGRPRGVSVDDCVRLTKAIEQRFDRDRDDFSLTVSSAGIGQPLKVLRQYKKLVGRQVEVVLGSGVKLIAALEAADENTLTLGYSKKKKTVAKKRPQTVTVTKTIPLAEIKATREHIDFK
jgi:ribosome maturation factor RimP